MIIPTFDNKHEGYAFCNLVTGGGFANWNETPNPQFDQGSEPQSGPGGSSDGGFGVSCQFGMNTYLEHPPVEAPFWDI